jgi:hypothetical protein
MLNMCRPGDSVLPLFAACDCTFEDGLGSLMLSVSTGRGPDADAADVWWRRY